MVDQRCIGMERDCSITCLVQDCLALLRPSPASGQWRFLLDPTWIEESYHIVSFSIHLRTHYADGKTIPRVATSRLLQTGDQVVQMRHLPDPCWRAECENHHLRMFNTYGNRQIHLMFQSNITFVTYLSGFLFFFSGFVGCVRGLSSNEWRPNFQSADCCCTTFQVGLVQAMWNSLVPVKRSQFAIDPVLQLLSSCEKFEQPLTRRLPAHGEVLPVHCKQHSFLKLG